MHLLFECVVGSRLYGTSTEGSDWDYAGVGVASPSDLLGLGKRPSEWDLGTDGVDRKIFHLPRFLELCLQGQPGQLEMLWARAQCATFNWHVFREKLRPLVSSSSAIAPFLGFAAAQAHKATIKGENLNLIRELISQLDHLIAEDSRIRVCDLLLGDRLCGVRVTTEINAHGARLITIAGRSWDTGVLARTLFSSLVSLEAKYGSRSNSAAATTYDFKSLSHAVRLIGEAEEFLLTGQLTFPRPNALILGAIKHGLATPRDWHAYLDEEIARVREDVLPRSILPPAPQPDLVESLCVQTLLEFLR